MNRQALHLILASADAALVAASLTIMAPLLRPPLPILKPCVRPGIDLENGTDRLQVSAGSLLDGSHRRADEPYSNGSISACFS